MKDLKYLWGATRNTLKLTRYQRRIKRQFQWKVVRICSWLGLGCLAISFMFFKS